MSFFTTCPICRERRYIQTVGGDVARVKCKGCGEWYNDSSEIGIVMVWENEEIRGGRG